MGSRTREGNCAASRIGSSSRGWRVSGVGGEPVAVLRARSGLASQPAEDRHPDRGLRVRHRSEHHIACGRTTRTTRRTVHSAWSPAWGCHVACDFASSFGTAPSSRPGRGWSLRAAFRDRPGIAGGRRGRWAGRPHPGSWCAGDDTELSCIGEAKRRQSGPISHWSDGWRLGSCRRSTSDGDGRRQEVEFGMWGSDEPRRWRRG